MDKLTVKANAKINLTLNITGRLPNGYHSLKSIMQSITLHDIVTVELTEKNDIEVICGGGIPSGEQNIAYKAADAFFRSVGLDDKGVRITIDKHIPSEAGLGGGSADAAAVICCLDRLFGCDMTKKDLCRIGTSVGADVPFCISGGTALCEGIGEVITPLSPLSCGCVLIAKGKLGVSTKEAYAKIDSAEIKHTPWDKNDFVGSFEGWARLCSNDFEAVSGNPEVDLILSDMKNSGAALAQMSGSGSAVFGLFSDEENAESCCKKLVSSGFFAEICGFSQNGIEYL